MQQNLLKLLSKESSSKHNGAGPIIISQQTLRTQILREAANANLDSETNDTAICVNSATTSNLSAMHLRPLLGQRSSSELVVKDPNLSEPPAKCESSATKLKRSASSTLAWNEACLSASSGNCCVSSETTLVRPSLRKASEAASSTSSDSSSSAVTTPTCDDIVPFWESGASHAGLAFGFGSVYARTLTKLANLLPSVTNACIVQHLCDCD